MTLEEWEKEAIKRFGIDRMKWKFVCPSCQTVIQVQEWKDAGAGNGAVAYSCIGRYLPEKQEFIGKKKKIKGKPCNYTTGGLFNISPIEVEGDHYFDFAEVNS